MCSLGLPEPAGHGPERESAPCGTPLAAGIHGAFIPCRVFLVLCPGDDRSRAGDTAGFRPMEKLMMIWDEIEDVRALALV